jgi:hypothetical protein
MRDSNLIDGDCHPPPGVAVAPGSILSMARRVRLAWSADNDVSVAARILESASILPLSAPIPGPAGAETLTRHGGGA